MRKDHTLDATLLEIRRRLVEGTLKWFSILAIPMLAASWYRVKETGWNSPIIIHVASAILVWCLYFSGRRSVSGY